MPTIRDTVIQFLQQIRGLGETAPHARGSEGAVPRLALSPGAEVLATVMGKLDNGMSLVRVSSQLFAMELPSRFQTGDSLRMTFLSQDARPTFALASQTLSGTPLTMSSAGRLLRRLMLEPLADEISSKSPLPKMERLVEGPPNDTVRLAGRLRQVLGESGLFYESHLKEWAKGERPLITILREPQAALSRPEARIRAAETAGAERVLPGRASMETAVSGMVKEEAAPEADGPFQREQRTAAPGTRETPTADGRVRAGEIRPEGRTESGTSQPRPESRDRSAEGGTDDRAASPATERLSTEITVKKPGRAAGDGETRDGVTTGLRDESGKPAGEAVPERRGTAGTAADDLRHYSAAERSAASPHIREQVSPRQESPEKAPALPESAASEGGVRIPAATDSAEKTPGAAEQRARLLREAYRQPDPDLVQRDARKAPGEMPRTEVESSSALSRPGPAAIGTDVNREAPRTLPAATAGLAAVEERKGADIAVPAASLQGEIADARALPLVRQQLNLLTSGLFLWQGEAWQGQLMEWEVMEREAHPEQGERSAWQTTLRLDLPNLGRVSAQITLEGNEVRLSLEAGAADSVSLLGSRTEDLRDRLSAAGIEVKGVAVRHEELEGA